MKEWNSPELRELAFTNTEGDWPWGEHPDGEHIDLGWIDIPLGSEPCECNF